MCCNKFVITWLQKNGLLFMVFWLAAFSTLAAENKISSKYSPTGVSFFQDQRMNDYDLQHLTLSIAVQSRSTYITANCVYGARALQALDTFAIEMAQSLQVDSVFAQGKKVNYQRRNNHIYIGFSASLPAQSHFKIAVFYKGNVAKGFYTGTDQSGLSYTASLSESFQAREWFPAKQLLNDKIDSTDMYITTHASNLTGSNGVLKAVVSLPNNQKQFWWSCRYPLSYYMPSVAVGNYTNYTLYAHPASIAPDSIPIQNFIVNKPVYLSQNKANIDKTARFIEEMSGLFGLYPFYKEKYGHCQADIGGGMEHATMTTLNNFNPSLVAHELAHQWFGDNVTCQRWNEIWLNESFATYGAYLMQEKLPELFSTSAAQEMADLHENALMQPLESLIVPEADSYNEDRIFSYQLSYAKGATVLHNLRFQMQSDSLFFKTLQTYQAKFANSFATTTNFKQVAEQVCKRNFDAFFNQQVLGAGFPTFNVIYSKYGSDTLVLDVTESVSASSVTPAFTGLIALKILSPQGDTTLTVNLTSASQVFHIYYTKTPQSLQVDPGNWWLKKVGLVKEGVSTMPPVPLKPIVYPNPVKTSFSVKMPAGRYTSARLTNVSGQVLRTYQIETAATRFSSQLALPAGVYFFQLLGSKGQGFVKKIVVD